MFHVVAHAARGRLLFSDARAATALWSIAVGHFPELIALCLMPDHVHVLLPVPPGLRLGHAMSAYTRWVEHDRRVRNLKLWTPHPAPEHLPDPTHVRRTLRYVLLNPCRVGLVADPLAWPWSTHRDRVGFAAAPVGPVEVQRARFHAYVSGDPSVAVGGTPMPGVLHRPFVVEDVADAVMAVFRASPEQLSSRHPARAAWVRAAYVHGKHDVGELAEATGLKARRVRQLVEHLPERGRELADPVLAACVAATGDRRFDGWPALRGLRGWGRYAGRASPLELPDFWSQRRRIADRRSWDGEDEREPAFARG